MTNNQKPDLNTNYADYLEVEKLIGLQNPKSAKAGAMAHEEMLFIIIHQVYELWFKQILFEVDSVLALFTQEKLDERDMLKIVSRLHRVIEIQKILIQQVTVLETMTPLDFLEFRDLLVPASGFQSHQFRMIENKMGLKQRMKFNNQDYKTLLQPHEQPKVAETEDSANLFTCLEKWLERTPFVVSGQFNFWQSYAAAVAKMFQGNEDSIKAAGLDAASEAQHLANLTAARESFQSIFNEQDYTKLQEQNMWRMSYKALQAALFIQLYRDEPLLQAPFNMMMALQNIDENFTMWRQRHALMAHRMLGAKMGTGGSAGHKYLATAADRHKVFTDLFNLSTFLVPRSQLPELPPDLKKKLNFHYT